MWKSVLAVGSISLASVRNAVNSCPMALIAALTVISRSAQNADQPPAKTPCSAPCVALSSPLNALRAAQMLPPAPLAVRTATPFLKRKPYGVVCVS
jgi:hypothetical protein